MNVIRKLVLVLAAVLLASVAAAQDALPEDDVLQRYVLATENLDAAVASLDEDATRARASLDQAFSALLTLSRDSDSTLGQSIDRVFERARAAIDNRSVTDLSVQVEVLRGGFQRLLYEAALTAAVEGDDEAARARLLRLASDVGLGSARVETLRAASGVGGLRRAFEAGVAEQTAARLETLAGRDVSGEADAVYRAFADAYGDYLLVQDSPRLGADTNRHFIEAANAIVDGDQAAFDASVRAVAEQLVALREAADAGAADVLGELPGAATDAPAPEGEAAGEGGASPPAAEGEAAEGTEGTEGGAGEGDDEAAALPLQEGETDSAAAAEGTPAGDASEGEAGAAADAPAPEGEAGPATEAELRETFLAEQEAERRDALVADLAAFGVAEGERAAFADRLLDAGMESVDDAETALAALASRLGAQVLRGESTAARARLADLSRTYATTLQPLAARVAPEAGASLRDLLGRLDEAPALRNEDVALLASELQALSEAMRGGVTPTAHAAIDAASSWWAGMIRPIVMIVLALLTLLPLRLLDMAFGGGNRNWRVIGLALFLLLLPVMYEGVAAAAALMAGPLGLPVLQELTAWSMFQNDLAQMAWAALVLLALILASIGFYGICVQFGVLGRGRAAAPAASPSTTRDDTLVDWDDDF